MMKTWCTLLFLLVTQSCGNRDPENKNDLPDGESIPISKGWQSLPYQLDNPDEKYTLPGSLLELSGMQSLDEKLIACVQDEKGIIYLFDRDQQQIVEEIRWGEDGDYEGIAGDGESLYVVRSDATVFKVSGYNSKATLAVEKWKTRLDSSCDAEGLFLHAGDALLLLACKGGSGGIRNVWAINLKDHMLQKHPYQRISQQTLEKKVVNSTLDRISLGVKKMFDLKGESGILAPSGIAVHPQTNDLYVISANSKLLLVFASTGELKNISILPSSIFIHPESITFTPAGHLLIGNEGKGTEASILFFEYDTI